jgi:hypothetical protein
MVKKNILLLLILMALMLFSGVYVIGGTQAYTRFQQGNLAMQEKCAGKAPVNICAQIPPTIFSAFKRFYLYTESLLFNINYSRSCPLTLLISVAIVGFSQWRKSVDTILVSHVRNRHIALML